MANSKIDKAWDRYLVELRGHVVFVDANREEAIARDTERQKTMRRGCRIVAGLSILGGSIFLAAGLVLGGDSLLFLSLAAFSCILLGLFHCDSSLFLTNKRIAAEAFKYAHPPAATPGDLERIASLVRRSPELAGIVEGWRDTMGELSVREAMKLTRATWYLDSLDDSMNAERAFEDALKDT